jgi:hypothetical protein
MIKKLKDNVTFPAVGKIAIGCKVKKALCPSCKKEVHSLKLDDGWYCQVCNTLVSPPAGGQEFQKMLPFFVLPKELKGVLGDRPASLKVIPISRDINKSFPNGYAKWGKSRKGGPLCSGDGEKATRINPNGAKEEVACSENCPELLKKNCKPEGTLFFILPEFNIMSAYTVLTHSEQSIGNIISTLNKLGGLDGVILRNQPCELKIIEKRRKKEETVYYVLDLIPPALSVEDFKKAIALEMSTQDCQIGYELAPELSGGDEGVPEGAIDVTPKTEGNAGVSQVDEAMAKGRGAVRTKISEFVKGAAESGAFDQYILKAYAKELEQLTGSELKGLWEAIAQGSDVVKGVEAQLEIELGRIEAVVNGRAAVRAKILRFIKDTHAADAFESYILKAYGKRLNLFTEPEIRKLWHAIAEGSDFVKEVESLVHELLESAMLARGN